MQRAENPELQAVCDRIVLDTANILYLASLMPAGAELRTAPAGETLLQVLGQLAAESEHQAARLRAARLWGSPPGGAAPAEPPAGLEAALASFRAARRVLLEQLHLLPPRLLEAAGAEALLPVVKAWTLLYARHGMDFADALPEVRGEAMVLNWLLHADFRGDAALVKRQRQLYQDAKRLASQQAEG